MSTVNKLTNESLKNRYNNIYTQGAYENYFTFNSYDILKAIIDSVDDWTDLNVLDIGCPLCQDSCPVS